MEILVPHVVSELSNEDMDILECGYRYLVNHKVSKLECAFEISSLQKNLTSAGY